MLKKSKKITIEGVVVINDTEVTSLRAILDTENPNDMTMYDLYPPPFSAGHITEHLV